MVHLIKQTGLLLLVTAVTACTSADVASKLYKVDRGPHEVRVSDDVVLTDNIQKRDVRFRVLAPASEGRFPVVVHSHGGFCPGDYDLFLSHWASHGYIVIAPYHADSPVYGKRPMGPVMETIVASRLRDLSFALDALDDIVAQADMPGQPSGDEIAVTGHSFGAGMALMKTGFYIDEKYREPWSQGYDARYVAAVFFSAPGGEPGVENPFVGLKTPFMATGGTLDQGRLDPGEMALGDFRRQVFLQAPPGDKYSVILDGADHYLGGLICNPERGGDPDPEAAAILGALTTAFLDAYVKKDAAAKAFLQTADIHELTNGRADYRRR